MSKGILLSPKATARFVVTLPQEPSKLVDALKSQVGASSTVLTDTSDAFRHLARRAQERLVLLMPFIDLDGCDWAHEVFAATEARERILILRSEMELIGCKRSGKRLRELVTAIKEYGGPDAASSSDTFHAKIVLADGVAAYVGSANLLRRSRDVQLECGMLVEGPVVASIKLLIDAVMMAVDSPDQPTERNFSETCMC